MIRQSSTKALLALMLDAQKFKRVFGWRKPTVAFYDGYIDADFIITDTVRSIPEHHADEWRIYADGGDLHFVLTYYYDPALD